MLNVGDDPNNNASNGAVPPFPNGAGAHNLSYYPPTAYEQYRLPLESTGGSGVSYHWGVSLLILAFQMDKNNKDWEHSVEARQQSAGGMQATTSTYSEQKTRTS